MHLLPDPLFSIPTDGVFFTSIVGSDNGRIFMAGKDGCLYELVYQVCHKFFLFVFVCSRMADQDFCEHVFFANGQKAVMTEVGKYLKNTQNTRKKGLNGKNNQH